MKKALYAAGLVLAVVYVLNPGLGVFELLPDNLPGVGNLDEAAAVALALTCWRRLRAGPTQSSQPPGRSDAVG